MKNKVILLIVFSFIICSCSKDEALKIALSKGAGSASYELYSKWLNSQNEKIEIINLYGLTPDDAVEMLKQCDGLVLTGGPDVHPVFFGREEDSSRCSIDNYRDTLEFALIRVAEELKMPVLGVCRGAQIFNVAYGGSLIIDIPDDTESEIPHQTSEGDVYHNISVEENSLLHSITESLFGTVNSNHHQSVDRLADGFIVTATTADGIVEAFENIDTDISFFLGVQWHPERMEIESRFSGPILIKFISEVKNSKLKILRK
ncbi:MAG: gamma-glutamyl-gamma-aminobutyrate hydrolase family protein [Candidatus Kapabacteria bacterium]|nr:gamma-glutamyl-gamma-aminobutyrate hydrolase family protein [Ignavibacteriota bacterium]MCW5883730.1 gamma-glutamyl-gamma-aminobutyrate hydrolase family protein [Candidatus Kapabacteria bacterium]